MSDTYQKIKDLLLSDRTNELVLLVPNSRIADCNKSMSVCGMEFVWDGWVDRSGKKVKVREFTSPPEPTDFVVMNFSDVYSDADKKAISGWLKR